MLLDFSDRTKTGISKLIGRCAMLLGLKNEMCLITVPLNFTRPEIGSKSIGLHYQRNAYLQMHLCTYLRTYIIINGLKGFSEYEKVKSESLT